MIAGFRAPVSKGYTLIEVVVALGLSLLTLSAVYSLYVTELKAQIVRENMLDMHQQARVVVDLVSREILMAGYDPRGVNEDSDLTNNFYGITYDPAQLIIKSDLNGNGTPSNANESIVFSLDSVTHTLRRNTGGGRQPFGENIESFVVQYWDQDGNPTTVSLSIRQVGITVTARTADPDPNYSDNGGYRTVTLHSRITPRNL
ncbi:MAG: prepilin-type N-terminal cleavage/methylation domain-containing protein [Nitrospirales bacterium]